MGVTAADIKWYLTGASSDGGAQADPDAALGNYRSSTEITNDSIENLFDNVTGAEATSGDIEYRCICIKNENASSKNWYNVKFFIQTNTPSGDSSIEFAVEAAEDGDSDGSAQTIGDESTSPTVGTGSVSAWGSGTTYAGGVGVNQGAHDANLDAGELIFLWLKRTIGSAASAYDADNVVMRAQGEATA